MFSSSSPRMRCLPSWACAAVFLVGCSDNASVASGADGSVAGSSGPSEAGGTSSGSSSGGGSGDATTMGGGDDASVPPDGGDASGAADNGGGMPGTVDMSVAVLERNKHPSRDGAFVQPMLTKAKAATMAPDAAFNATFTGAMWATPLYLDQGPGGTGIFVAVTSGNDVFALDETDGHTVWQKNIGNSPQNPGVGCGNVHPIGILSTPVIDPKPGADGFATIYVAGAIGTNGITAHEVHALSAKDGSERAGWPVNASMLQAAAAQAAGVSFALPAINQRGGLSLVGGIVYVAYGGFYGDCGAYHGFVVSIDAADPTKAAAWVSQGTGEGIWAAGGMASDGLNGVFAVTGNRTGGGGPHQDCEEVIHVTGLGVLDRTNANIFYPSDWARMDGSDLDFGSSSPVYFSVPGSTPGNYLGAVTKDGTFFLLDSANLGGMDGQLAKLTIADLGMSIHTALAAYTSASGVHVVLQANNAHCPGGGGDSVVSISVPAGAPPVPSVAWCTPQSGANAAPISTTTDGKSDAIVWFMRDQTLVGVDGDTGANVVTAPGQCGGVHQWTAPIAVKGRIIVGADGRLCSWSPH